MRMGMGPRRSGVDPPLSSSCACLHTAFSVQEVLRMYSVLALLATLWPPCGPNPASASWQGLSPVLASSLAYVGTGDVELAN